MSCFGWIADAWNHLDLIVKGNQEWAAWAQAILSVAAIGAAIFISSRDHNLAILRQEEEKRRARIDWLNKIAQIIDYCANEFRIAASLHSTDESEAAAIKNYSWSFEYLREVLEGIDVAELPDQLSIAFMFDLRKNLVRAEALCKESKFLQRHTEDGKRVSDLRSKRFTQYESSAVFGLNNLRAHIQVISAEK